MGFENIKNQDVIDFLGNNGLFAHKVTGFAYRKSQVEMAKRWQECLFREQDRLLVCEAGTGTGKTYAYLLPTLLSGRTTVISTASKALQDQLVRKDLPKLFSVLGLDPDFMALKGFSNYLCRYKFKDLVTKFHNDHALNIDESSLSDVDKLNYQESHEIISAQDIAKIELLIEKSLYEIEKDVPQPCFAEVNSLFSKQIVSKITCQSENCLRGRCPYFDECFPLLARQKSIRSKVVVINHSLFFAAMQIEDLYNIDLSILLPHYSTIIFDEAHELPSIGREHLSESVGSYDLKKFEEDIKYLKKLKTIPYMRKIEENYAHLKSAYSNLGAYLSKAGGHSENKRNILYFIYDDYNEEINDPFFVYKKKNQKFRMLVGALYKALVDTKNLYETCEEFDSETFSRYVSYVQGKIATLVDLMNIDSPENRQDKSYGKYVGTAETGKKSFALILSPLEISDSFGKYLSDCANLNISVLLTSATLSVAGSFNKILTDLGAPEHTKTMTVESVFDYYKQSAVYMSGSFPDPADPYRIDTILKSLIPLIDSVKGGIFVLTTSHMALKSANAFFISNYRGKRKIFCQNETLSNSIMLEKFKDDGNAVLIGTASFWAGVDVPGKALSLVIIDKLPFTTPSDPIFKARCNYYDAHHKGRSFIDIAVPEAVIDLRQGVGRLIRHENDKGRMVICDPRIINKSFGKIFIKSLPQMRQFSSLDEFVDFD
ncbi:MAG: ATP-dependent DNA helicase [Succinivibrio sp.]